MDSGRVDLVWVTTSFLRQNYEMHRWWRHCGCNLLWFREIVRQSTPWETDDFGLDQGSVEWKKTMSVYTRRKIKLVDCQEWSAARPSPVLGRHPLRSMTTSVHDHVGPRTEMAIHFSPWPLRSLTISIQYENFMTISVHDQIGLWPL